MSRQLIVWLGSKAISYSNFENILQAQTLYNLREIKLKWNRMFPCLFFFSELLIIGWFDGPILGRRADHSFSHFIPKIKSKSIGFSFLFFSYTQQMLTKCQSIQTYHFVACFQFIFFMLFCCRFYASLNYKILSSSFRSNKKKIGDQPHSILFFCYLKKNPWISMKSYCKPKKMEKKIQSKSFIL